MNGSQYAMSFHDAHALARGFSLAASVVDFALVALLLLRPPRAGKYRGCYYSLALCDAFYSVSFFFACTCSIVSGDVVVMAPLEPDATVPFLIWQLMYNVLLLNISICFLIRFGIVCNQKYILRILHSRSLFTACAILGAIVVGFSYVMLFVIYDVSDSLRERATKLFHADTDIDFSHEFFFGFDHSVPREPLVQLLYLMGFTAFIFYSFGLIGIMLGCGIGMSWYIRQNSISARLRADHKRVLAMLCIQAAVPIVLVYCPSMAATAAIALRLDVRIFAPLSVVTYSAGPLCSPFVTVAFTRQYRFLVSRWVKRSLGLVGINVSLVTTSTGPIRSATHAPVTFLTHRTSTR